MEVTVILSEAKDLSGEILRLSLRMTTGNDPFTRVHRSRESSFRHNTPILQYSNTPLFMGGTDVIA
jgi:hypothetical protein